MYLPKREKKRYANKSTFGCIFSRKQKPHAVNLPLSVLNKIKAFKMNMMERKKRNNHLRGYKKTSFFKLKKNLVSLKLSVSIVKF